MGNVPAAPNAVTAVKAQVTVTLSPAIQQKLITLNSHVFSAINMLKELGLIDAAQSLNTGKALTSQSLNISPVIAAQMCQVLSRVSVTDPVAAEAGVLINSIPSNMRTHRPGMATPMSTKLVSSMRPPKKAK